MPDPTVKPPDAPQSPVGAKFPAATLSAVERAAARGIGPMSILGRDTWHGQAAPCVSCGELAPRAEMECPHCGQDLTPGMLAKMQAHAGPWYVLEHVRPFPGVTLDRLIRQAQRGILTTTTIVRGPTTHHQWRFAAETPGLSKHLGVCWKCHARVTPQDTYCDACDAHLDRLPGHARPEAPPPAESRENELERLSKALKTAPRTGSGESTGTSRRGLPAPLIIIAILIISIFAVVAAVKVREDMRSQSKDARKPTPAALMTFSNPLSES